MKIYKLMFLGFGSLAILLAGQAAYAVQDTPIPTQLPVKGMVTMIDLGATECIPCKMMAPIMARLEKVYAGRAAIVFIDVWKNKEQVGRFGIQAIPTQVFFNENGIEVYRHVGFMSEEDIVTQLEKMGIR